MNRHPCQLSPKTANPTKIALDPVRYWCQAYELDGVCRPQAISGDTRRKLVSEILLWEAGVRIRTTVWVMGLVLLFFVGCAYVDVRTPYDTDLNQTRLGSKTGTAEAYSLLWLVAWGDASYTAAAKNGQITVMQHADQEVLQVLFGLYTRWRIVVYGD